MALSIVGAGNTISAVGAGQARRQSCRLARSDVLARRRGLERRDNAADAPPSQPPFRAPVYHSGTGQPSHHAGLRQRLRASKTSTNPSPTPHGAGPASISASSSTSSTAPDHGQQRIRELALRSRRSSLRHRGVDATPDHSLHLRRRTGSARRTIQRAQREESAEAAHHHRDARPPPGGEPRRSTSAPAAACSSTTMTVAAAPGHDFIRLS